MLETFVDYLKVSVFFIVLMAVLMFALRRAVEDAIVYEMSKFNDEIADQLEEVIERLDRINDNTSRNKRK